MLKFFASLDKDDVVSEDGDQDDIRLTFSFDGRQGGAQVRQLFIQNDDPGVYYNNIIITPVDLSGTGYVDDGGDSWSWKIMQRDSPPTEGSWKSVSDGNPLSVGTLSDASAVISIWVRVQVPQYTPAQQILSIRLRVEAEEVLNA